MSVLISGDTSDDLVGLPAGLTVRDSAGGSPLALPDKRASQWRVAVAPSGVNRVSYRLLPAGAPGGT